MARKFLYFIAILIVLVIAGLVVMRVWADELTRFAFVPRGTFEQQAPLAASVYEDPTMWISRPGIGPTDPAQWVPPLQASPADSTATSQPANTGRPTDQDSKAAVFFIHPTSYLARDHWNGPLDDAESRARAELFVRGMASPFNRSVALWAPRYRQAAFGSFLTDSPDAIKARDLAYADVLLAWDYFLSSTPPETPIFLAGHSQGALLLLRLLKDRVAGTPLAQRVIAAYPVGWPVSIAHDLPLLGLPACATPDQAGCVMSWSSFAEPADPSSIVEAYDNSPGFDGKSRTGTPILCSNPLTGGIGGTAPGSANLGTLVPSADMETGKIVPAMVPARCDERGFLLIGDPPQLGSYVLPGNNYHVYDIPLFWSNLRADTARREKAWLAASGRSPPASAKAPAPVR